MKKIYEREKGEMGVGTLIIFIAMIIVAAVAATVLIQTAYRLQQQAEETGNIATQDVATGFKVITIQGIRNDIMYNESLGNISVGSTTFIGNLTHVPVNPNSVIVTNGTFELKDDGTGNLVPVSNYNNTGVTGTINYNTGEITLKFPNATVSSRVNVTYGSGYSPIIDYLEIKVGLMAGSPPISLFSVLVEISDGYTDATLTYNESATSFKELDGSHFGVAIARDMPPCNWERDRVITSGDIIKILINASAIGLYLQPQSSVMIKLIPKHGVPNLVEFETPSTYTTKYINLW